MATHISPKNIKENILSVTPVASIKGNQNLDGYIRKLLIGKKKNNRLNQEKVLKGIQDQVIAKLTPLSKLWSTMELERNAISEEDSMKVIVKWPDCFLNCAHIEFSCKSVFIQCFQHLSRIPKKQRKF